ncbi:MAG: DUF3267 domain-containing protein [Saprospirales bacterium]|nr:DUF3267 domain-containing protein [Saprospirales bacterium]MBK8491513.1 DUF3267 domain-containing protein [Saprospirales bacterium]
MHLHPQDLPAHGYRLLTSLHHQELIPFVQEHLRSNNWIARSYQILTMGLLGVSMGYILVSIIRTPGDWDRILTYFSYGLALAFLLAPIHELIHGIALKIVGAPSVQYRANWRKLYFMAASDRFVTNDKEFYWIAFPPFAVVSMASIAMLLFLPFPWTFTALGLLTLHTAFCAGDFALAAFMNIHKNQGILTYDLTDEQLSFFYVKAEE